MSGTGQTTIFVQIADSWIKDQEQRNMFGIPPRSRLYGLEPIKAKTTWAESLTSYINRLGWRHGVSPRALVEQEIVPYLSNDSLRRSSTNRSSFARDNAMSVNGLGSLPIQWATLLGKLTGRSDLHLLTLHQWIGDLPSHILLKKNPAWCSLCYAGWREQQLPIYQPLLWMLQIVTICTKHKCWLETCCPYCQKSQSVIALKTSPGRCTQCNTWLGTTSNQKSVQEIDDETKVWQEWIVHALKELYIANTEKNGLCWRDFLTHLTECVNESGISYKKLARLIGIDDNSFYFWVNGISTPSLNTLLSLCYASHVTPFQIMTGQLAPLKEVIQSGTFTRSPLLRRSSHQIDRVRCMQLIQDVLNGREEPLGVLQLAKRLGHEAVAIKYHFPKECALITELARKYRGQRKEQRVALVCEEVRQIVIRLHNQGIFPSWRKVKSELTNPKVMRMPEVGKAWHAARKDLGIEQ